MENDNVVLMKTLVYIEKSAGLKKTFLNWIQEQPVPKGRGYNRKLTR